MKRLSGQNILITGASSGFGRSIALACAREGANVGLVARREPLLQEVAAMARAEGVNAFVYAIDVADDTQVYATIAKAEAELGPIDVVVNNAGTNMKERTITNTSIEQWRLILEVNLTSAFVFTKAIMPHMIERKQGTIINLASRAATIPSLLAGAAYSTSKIGMDALTDVTNEEGNPHNIRACLLCPGVGATPILDKRPVETTEAALRVMLQEEDLGETVVFVASLPQRVNIERINLKPTMNPDSV